MGGDRWGCASAPPPVVVVVVVVVHGFKGEVLLKDCSVRHATSLSPIQSLPLEKKKIHRNYRDNFYFRTFVNWNNFRNIISYI